LSTRIKHTPLKTPSIKGLKCIKFVLTLKTHKHRTQPEHVCCRYSASTKIAELNTNKTKLHKMEKHLDYFILNHLYFSAQTLNLMNRGGETLSRTAKFEEMSTVFKRLATAKPP
ncbi:hypothetical protein AMECASPLE_039621, partial [Ameca splendens]